MIEVGSMASDASNILRRNKVVREGSETLSHMQAVGLHRFAACSETRAMAGLSIELTITLIGW